MTLKEQIQEDMKTAMRAKETLRLSTIRMLLAAIKQKEVDGRIELNDENILDILTKMVKQRKDSADIYTQAARSELAQKELDEIIILQNYLPQALSSEEIEKLIQEAIVQSEASSMKDMGKVMNLLRPQLAGRADMGIVSQMIKAALSS